ncbi:hypothetical protein Goshw_000047 [Gossypium schwendimanii]|uniref:Myb/SANT-like domain-containing protein n=2 Tax=Gossypium schwendimanii TaxID=34291 RepID=A0A7J9LZN1_GOSSC|nr:hypothetical protein [Gossypium schwendimanii]
MVDLYNVGTYNANMRFKVGYLNEMKRMLEKVLPHVTLKAKPNLESRIRTLKRDWEIVYNMFNGKDNSEFGWDKHRVIKQPVNSDIVVSLIIDQLTSIYVKDRATMKDAQTAVNIVEEIDAEDVAIANNLEEGNNYHGCEDDVSLD